MRETEKEGWALVAKLLESEENDESLGSGFGAANLDERTQQLLSIAVLIALGEEKELKKNFAAALSLGLTATELMDTIQHCALLTGFPRSLTAMKLLKNVVDEK